jgi:DNA-binding MarR family transcriptional regulator
MKGHAMAAPKDADRETDQGYRPPISVTRPEVLIDGTDDRFRDLIYALFVTGFRFQEIRESFGREIDVTGPQYFVLMAVAHFHAEGGVGIGGLADHLHVAPPHVTTEVGKLVERGLLAKQPNPEDGRRVLVTLTEAGKAALERLAPFRQHINSVLFDGFSHAEFLTLARLLERFLTTTERAQDAVADHERKRRRTETEAAQAAQAAE